MIFAAFVLLFYSNCTYGQYDWKQGYIICNNGDTLRGYIDFRLMTTNQKACYFKTCEDGKTEIYKPNEIKGYHIINGNVFISKSLEISGTENIMFLELLAEGKASIYRFLDYEKTRFFIEKDGKLTELKNSESTITINNKDYYRKNNEYIGTLMILLQDANINKDIKRTDFNDKSLIRIAKIYNAKISPDEQGVFYEKESSAGNFSIGLTFGGNLKTFEVIDIYGETRLRDKVSNYGGITFCISEFPGAIKRFSFSAEALISSYYYENKLRRHFLAPLYVGYRLSSEDNYPQIEAGITCSFMEPGLYVAPMAGIGLYFSNQKKQRFYIKLRVEDIPSFVRIGAGIYF